MLGVILGLSAAVGFGSAAVFARIGLQRMRSTTGTLVSLIVGTVITMALAFALDSEEIFALGAGALLWFLLAGVFQFPLGRLLNFTSVALAGVSRSSPIVGSSPLFATMLAVTIGGESINLPILAGTFSITSGLALLLSQR